MKFKVLSIIFILVSLILSCQAGKVVKGPERSVTNPVNQVLSPQTQEPWTFVSQAQPETYYESADFIQKMERITEIERSGNYFQGLALFESALREEAGDYCGAVIAAYKELSWIYSYGGTPKDEVLEGIKHIFSIDSEESPAAVLVNNTALAVMAIIEESWSKATQLLNETVPQYDEPDSFYQWMLLVCSLESGSNDHITRSAYGAIRGRYDKFPEYWYRGARAFNSELAPIYAEHCINLNTDGPFAKECRDIIASLNGLEGYGKNLRTQAEIEYYIEKSVSEADPVILDYLFPLLDLPDNKYTHYALGALQSLAGIPDFRSYFLNQAAQNSGRLSERLAYISRSLP
ncbi:MAG: hypothetical protein LBI14_03300 [Treponema sp.]|jgi:hypothetical protein|nr:hypothetical protein [Treponema sp.]